MTPAKFKFDTEFSDGGDRVSMAARARAKKALSQDEIDQMCAKARAEGMKAGEARALDAIASATHDMAALLRQALAATHNDIEALRREAAEIAVAAARKLATLAIEALPAADVEQAMRDALHQAIGEPRVVLRAAPVAALRARFGLASSRGPAAIMRAALDFLRAAVFGCSARRAAARSTSTCNCLCSPSINAASPASIAVSSRRK